MLCERRAQSTCESIDPHKPAEDDMRSLMHLPRILTVLSPRRLTRIKSYLYYVVISQNLVWGI